MTDGSQEVLSKIPEQQVPYDLERARQGVKVFQQIYERADDRWKRILTQSNVGVEVQELLLGTRAVIYESSRDVLGIFTEVIPGLRAHVPELSNYQGSFYLPGQVERFVEWYHLAPKGSQIDADAFMRHIEDKRHEPDDERIAGLLCGFPVNAVEQFVRNRAALSRWIHATGNFAGYPESDQEFVMAWEAVSIKEEDRDPYRDTHQKEAQAFIEKYLPSLTPEEQAYLLSRRAGGSRGYAEYVQEAGSANDIAYKQNINRLFEDSGMNDFLRSVGGRVPTPDGPVVFA